MKKEVLTCDIEDLEHSGDVESTRVRAMLDHDQEDGKSKVDPYFEDLRIEMCASCRKYMVENRRIIYAYGAMGFNKYYLK